MGPGSGGDRMGRPEQGSYKYKVSYGQTPDVKMGQKLGPARAGVIVRLLAVLATHKHSQPPPAIIMSDLRWRTTALKPDC